MCIFSTSDYPGRQLTGSQFTHWGGFGIYVNHGHFAVSCIQNIDNNHTNEMSTEWKLLSVHFGKGVSIFFSARGVKTDMIGLLGGQSCHNKLSISTRVFHFNEADHFAKCIASWGHSDTLLDSIFFTMLCIVQWQSSVSSGLISDLLHYQKTYLCCVSS